jgi:hypothetical protein
LQKSVDWEFARASKRQGDEDNQIKRGSQPIFAQADTGVERAGHSQGSAGCETTREEAATKEQRPNWFIERDPESENNWSRETDLRYQWRQANRWEWFVGVKGGDVPSDLLKTERERQ